MSDSSTNQTLTSSSYYQPFGSALEVLYAKERVVLMCGLVGTGKSRAILEKLHLFASKYPNSRILIARKVRADLTEAALVTFEDKVLPEGHYLRDGLTRRNRQNYNYRNGSVIAVKGLDFPERVMSSEWDFIYVQEATECDEADIETLGTRLRNWKIPYQQLLLDCNPDAPTHWLHRWIEEGRLNHIFCRHEDNPRLYDHCTGEWTTEGQIYRDELQKLTGHRRDRWLYGKWCAAEGARFPTLDSTIHQFDMWEKFPYGLPQNARIIIGVDYGTNEPFCALWCYVDHDKNVWVYRELYEREVPADEQARKILRATGTERIDAVYIDPAMAQNMSRSVPGYADIAIEDFYIDAMREDPRFGPVLHGFNAHRSHRLATLDSMFAQGNGYPNLYIEKGCVNLWKELCNAVWDPSGKEDIDQKRCQDHAIDALGYAVHTYLVGTKPQEPSYDDNRRKQVSKFERDALRKLARRVNSRR